MTKKSYGEIDKRVLVSMPDSLRLHVKRVSVIQGVLMRKFIIDSLSKSVVDGYTQWGFHDLAEQAKKELEEFLQ